MSNTPPAHKTEAVFRRYESHIFSIVTRWPDSTVINPSPLKPVTFVGWIRNAIASAIEYNWPSSVDIDKLRTIRPKLEITEKDGYVVARNTDTLLKTAASGKIVAELLEVNFSVVIDNPPLHVLHALAILFSEKHLTKPAKLTNVNADFLTQVTNKFDIGLTPEGDNIVIMI